MELTPALESTLRRYALGGLEEGPRLELEERLVTDPEAFEALGVVEQELTEEYQDDRLSSADRASFEAHFLTRPEGQRLLGFVRLLMDRAANVNPEPDQPSPALWTRISEFFRIRPAWAIRLASILVATAVGVLMWTRPSAPPPDSAVIAPGPGPSTPVKSPEYGPVPPAPQTARPLASEHLPTFTLAQGFQRHEGPIPRITIAAGAKAVRLRLEPAPSASGSFVVEVQDAQRKTVLTLRGLRPDEKGPLTIVLPARLLPHGDYLIVVSTMEGSKPEAIATYRFRVVTP
jgi:hypothetical protein